MVSGRRALGAGLIAGILVLAFVLRIEAAHRQPYKPINDAGSYLTIASYVARTGDYSLKTTPGSGAGGTRGPSAYFAPGFPYFLGLVDLIDGHAVRRGPAIQPVRDSQAVLGTITVALVGLVAFELFGTTAGLIALAARRGVPGVHRRGEHHRGREPADPAGARGPLHRAPGPPGGPRARPGTAGSPVPACWPGSPR